MLEWLKKHSERRKSYELALLFRELASKLLSAEEIVRFIGERYKRIKPVKTTKFWWRSFELRRVELVYQLAYNKLKDYARAPLSSDMDPYHRELVQAFVGDEYDRAIIKVRKSLKIISRLWREYYPLILASQTREEAKKLRREACGRILSVVRRLRRSLDVIRKTVNELSKTHVVSEGLPVVVVAGAPNVGKSTLVSIISTAKPEIAPYPFTTKTIIVGKNLASTPPYYIVDTPGILDKDPVDYNAVERKAFVALKALADVVIILVDPTENCPLTLERQLRLIQTLKREFKDKVKGIIVNKIDLINQEELVNVINYINSKVSSMVDWIHATSLIKGYGVNELKQLILRSVKELTL